MASCTFAIALFLVFVSFNGYAQCKDHSLTPFGKKAREDIPDDNFNKIFAVNYESEEELAEAVEASGKNFYETIGLPYDESVVKKLNEINRKLGKSNLTPEKIFHAYTYAISKAFKDLGFLTDDTMDDLARNFADKINKSAENLDEDDITSTLVALTSAVGNFFKSKGVTSKDKVDVVAKYFNQELDQYQKKNRQC